MDQISLLDADACARWCAEVDALKAHWHQRRPPHGFYTLGAAAYLDASVQSREAYEAARAQTSPLLKSRVGSLLDQVANAVAAATGREAIYDDVHYALPGFHIYEAHPKFAAPVAKIHCDRQYEGLDWSSYGIHPHDGKNLSFTLSLELPSGGGGLNVWPVSHREHTVDRKTSRKSFTPEYREYHAYEVGGLIIHAGDLVHQAVIQCDPQATGRRITLQGHAVDLGAQWLLYW